MRGQVQVVISNRDNTSTTHKLLSQLCTPCIIHTSRAHLYGQILGPVLASIPILRSLSMSTPEHSDHTDQKETPANNHCTNTQEYRPSIYPCYFVGFLKQLGALV